MSESEVLNRIGDYRVVLNRDNAPFAPDGDGYTPIIRADWHEGWNFEAVNPQAEAVAEWLKMSAMSGMGHDTLDLVSDALRNHFGALKVQEYGPSPYTDSHYIAFDTTVWREEMGNPDPSSEDYLSDYRAYLEGDVYTWAIEKRRPWYKVYNGDSVESAEQHEEWVRVELLADTADYEPGNLVYGEEWAKGEALADFHAFRREVLGIPEAGTPEVPSWGDINRLHLANNLAAVYGRNHKNNDARWAAVVDEAIRLIQSTD